MKKTAVVFFMVAAVVLSLVIFSKARASTASPGSFDGVMPFATSEGLIGFFDQKDGKVYIYDGTLERCLQVSQVEQLGQGIKIVQKNF